MQNTVESLSDEAWIAATLKGRRVLTLDECERLELLGEKSVAPLLNALKDRRIPEARRALCEQILIRIGEPAIPAVTRAYLEGKHHFLLSATRVLEQLHGERTREIIGNSIGKFCRKPLHRRAFDALINLALYLFVLTLITKMLPDDVQTRLGVEVFSLAILGAGLIGYLSMKDRKQPQRMLAIKVLANDRTRPSAASTLNYFAPCLADPDRQIRILTVSTVLPMLVRLQPSDRTCLTPETMKRLFAALDGSDLLLSLGILDCLERTGDETAIAPVRRLATGWRVGIAHNVRQRAKEVLQVLVERAERLEPQRSLLRPSDAPDEKERLLRPIAQSNSDPDILLRAAQAEHERPGDAE